MVRPAPSSALTPTVLRRGALSHHVTNVARAQHACGGGDEKHIIDDNQLPPYSHDWPAQTRRACLIHVFAPGKPRVGRHVRLAQSLFVDNRLCEPAGRSRDPVFVKYDRAPPAGSYKCPEEVWSQLYHGDPCARSLVREEIGRAREGHMVGSCTSGATGSLCVAKFR